MDPRRARRWLMASCVFALIGLALMTWQMSERLLRPYRSNCLRGTTSMSCANATSAHWAASRST
jgi:hypothetical protein